MPLWETGNFVPALPRPLSFNAQLAFVGSDSLPSSVEVGGRVPIHALWRRIGPIDQIYCGQFFLIGEGGNIVADSHRLGYTFYPVQDWPSGSVVRELFNLVVPTDTPPGTYTVGLRVTCEVGRRMRVLSPDPPGALEATGIVPLGTIDVVPVSPSLPMAPGANSALSEGQASKCAGAQGGT